MDRDDRDDREKVGVLCDTGALQVNDTTLPTDRRRASDFIMVYFVLG